MRLPPAVEAIDLAKHFGDNRAVDGVSFVVPTGSVLGLLGPTRAGHTTPARPLTPPRAPPPRPGRGVRGPSGAGKTPLVRMLTTLSVPTSGTGRVAGFDVREQPDAVRRSLGLTGQAATGDQVPTGRAAARLWAR